MFGLSFWEIALILAVALLVLGPTKLPELARSLGKGIREFRRATEDFKSTIDEEMNKPEPPPSRQLPPAQRVEERATPPAVSEELAEPLAPDAPTVERQPAHAYAASDADDAPDAPTADSDASGSEAPRTTESKA